MSEDRMIPIKKSDNSHYTIDEIGSIEFGFFNPENLQLLFKSAAIGMPLAVLIGFFPQAMKGLLEDLPNLFADRKFGKYFKEYCEKRAEELKKNPEIQEALKTKNSKALFAAIKNNLNKDDEKVHREAVIKGFGKTRSEIDPNQTSSSSEREDIIAHNLDSVKDHETGIYSKLAKLLKHVKKPATAAAKEKEPEDLPIGAAAVAETKIEEQLLDLEENLHKWFKEKWVRFGPDGKIRGQCAREKSSEGKPKCRPLKSAQAMGKKGRATAARRKRREDPNPDRSGKAKNVKTEEIYMENVNENRICPICGGELVSEVFMNEKKDACYYKVKSRYKVWPSAYASGALVKCRKKGAGNWGTKTEGFEEVDEACWKGYHKEGNKKMFGKTYPNCVKNTNEQEELDEKWSEKYKRSIDCSHPKGFSQKAHCQGRKKTEEQLMKENTLRKLIRETVEEVWNEQQAQQDECWECYEAAMEEGTNEAWEECYRKTNWAMVPEGEEHTCEGDEFYEIYGDINADSKENLEEAEYHGRKVPLGKPMRGDVKKFKVFVRNPSTGKVKKVNFGDKKMRIKKSNPKRRKSFRARHNCANPGPRTKARYWSCRKW